MDSQMERTSSKAVDCTGKMGLAERTPGKMEDCVGRAGLAKWETKASKLIVNYCHGGRNSQSHTREFLGMWG